MKLLKYFSLSLLLGLLMTYNLRAQDNDLNVNIDAESDLDLSDYNSYFWVTDFGNGSDLWITVNGLEGEMIKDAIEYEMDVKNLEWTPQNPDLLVNFHVFDKKYGKEYYMGDSPYEYRYMDKQEIMDNIKDGTLVVSLIDKDKGKSVWEGYATIAVDESETLREQQADIRQAVSAIFDRYNPNGLSQTTSSY